MYLRPTRGASRHAHRGRPPATGGGQTGRCALPEPLTLAPLTLTLTPTPTPARPRLGPEQQH
eukprot:scaffold67338_cov43-Phaeocystis_antarctica.AAC.1